MTSDDELSTSRIGDTDTQMDVDDIEQLPTDPDPGRDLGYELSDWERITTADDSQQLVFLPEEEEMLLQDAFIIVEEDDLCDLRTRS
jgi:hypothetical protein